MPQYFVDAIAGQPFAEIGARLAAEVQVAMPRLRTISDAQSSLPRGPGRWSGKQILGHLIDSAANNHQRFVRMQAESGLALPGYAQEHWVASQRYQERSWADLIELWSAYNRHLAHMLAVIPESARSARCTIGGGPSFTLSYVALDYVGHLQHHLGQIFG